MKHVKLYESFLNESKLSEFFGVVKTMFSDIKNVVKNDIKLSIPKLKEKATKELIEVFKVKLKDLIEKKRVEIIPKNNDEFILCCYFLDIPEMRKILDGDYYIGVGKSLHNDKNDYLGEMYTIKLNQNLK